MCAAGAKKRSVLLGQRGEPSAAPAPGPPERHFGAEGRMPSAVSGVFPGRGGSVGRALHGRQLRRVTRPFQVTPVFMGIYALGVRRMASGIEGTSTVVINRANQKRPVFPASTPRNSPPSAIVPTIKGSRTLYGLSRNCATTVTSNRLINITPDMTSYPDTPTIVEACAFLAIRVDRTVPW